MKIWKLAEESSSKRRLDKDPDTCPLSWYCLQPASQHSMAPRPQPCHAPQTGNHNYPFPQLPSY